MYTRARTRVQYKTRCRKKYVAQLPEVWGANVVVAVCCRLSACSCIVSVDFLGKMPKNQLFF